MDIKSIIDLPNEVIEKFLMVFLSSNDVCSFGMTGIKRFKEIAEAVLEKRSTLIIYILNKCLVPMFYNISSKYISRLKL